MSGEWNASEGWQRSAVYLTALHYVRCTVALVFEATGGLCRLFVFVIIGVLVELMLACWVQS